MKIEIILFTSVEGLQSYHLKIREKHSFRAGFTKEKISEFQILTSVREEKKVINRIKAASSG